MLIGRRSAGSETVHVVHHARRLVRALIGATYTGSWHSQVHISVDLEVLAFACCLGVILLPHRITLASLRRFALAKAALFFVRQPLVLQG